MHNPHKLNIDSSRNRRNMKIIKIAVENANLCRKKYAICALCWNIEKCGNMRNMWQSHIRVKLTYLVNGSWNVFWRRWRERWRDAGVAAWHRRVPSADDADCSASVQTAAATTRCWPVSTSQRRVQGPAASCGVDVIARRRRRRLHDHNCRRRLQLPRPKLHARRTLTHLLGCLLHQPPWRSALQRLTSVHSQLNHHQLTYGPALCKVKKYFCKLTLSRNLHAETGNVCLQMDVIINHRYWCLGLSVIHIYLTDGWTANGLGLLCDVAPQNIFAQCSSVLYCQYWPFHCRLCIVSHNRRTVRGLI